ncbi:MAG TPA: hypothetical protein VN751_11595 [Solirubrobacteraceae bacterium]|jgi:hypothetical protein|nr:hypothetical protein [Solirubrobacteraceae bacterium]
MPSAVTTFAARAGAIVATERPSRRTSLHAGTAPGCTPSPSGTLAGAGPVRPRRQTS